MLTKEPSSLKGSSISNTYFFIQGIGTLLPYSAIISTLDFFDARYPTANVAFTFPLANFASNIILTFSMVYVKKNTSLSFRIPICSFITVLLLLGMPIVGLLLPNSILGLWILYLFLFLIGAFNTITNATVVGIAGHFPMGCMGSNTTGTSVSGLMSNVLRAICLAIFPYGVSAASTRTEILIYYGTSTVFLLFCIFLYYKFIDTEFAVAYLPQESHLVVVHPREAADYDILEEGVTAPEIDNTGWSKAKDNFKELYRVLKQLKLLSLVMLICHIQTLMLSPGVMLERSLKFLNPAWNIVVQLAVFNFFDALGKVLTFIRWTYNETLVTIVTALRMVFYYTFIVQALGLDYNIVGEDWFTFVNVALFGLTNGYITSAVFILSPSKVEGHDKEIAGFLALLNLLLGITVGSIGALPLRYLHDY